MGATGTPRAGEKPVRLKTAGKAVGAAVGGLGVSAVVARAVTGHGLPAVAWAALIVLVAVSAVVAGLALALDYRRARLEIAASAAESRDRAVLELYRLETYRDLVGKAAGEPASAASYRDLILADALRMAVEGGKVRPADQTHRWLFGSNGGGDAVGSGSNGPLFPPTAVMNKP